MSVSSLDRSATTAPFKKNPMQNINMASLPKTTLIYINFVLNFTKSIERNGTLPLKYFAEDMVVLKL
jgi:hypothetical protein